MKKAASSEKEGKVVEITRKRKAAGPVEAETTAVETEAAIAETQAPEAENLPAPPKMVTPYGQIEGATEETPVSSMPEGFTATDALTGVMVSGPEKEPFEEVSLKLPVVVVREALSVAMAVANKSGGYLMPILTTVLLTATKEATTIEATDLEVAWKRTITHIPGSGYGGGPVKRCIPATVFYNEVKALPDGIDDLELFFKEHTVTVNGRCEINTDNAEEYPELHIPESIDLPVSSGLLAAMKRVIPAVSKDATRYTLQGLYLDFPAGKAVGTDGFRMHTEDFTAGADMNPCLLPAKTAQLMIRHGRDVIGWLDDKHIYTSCGNGVLTGRVMEGNFPDYKSVIPKALRDSVTFDREGFLNLVQGANGVSDGQIFKLTVNGDLTIESEGAAGQYKWHIGCLAELKNPFLGFNFNARFFTEAIKAYSETTVTLKVPSSYGACLINEKVVIMPIRV